MNQAEALEQTLISIIKQDYKPKQLIVIDGGSTADTIQVLKKYTPYLNKLIIEPDEGIYDAMNKGIPLAKGHWIQFMNAGDRYVGNDSLSQMMAATKRTHSLVYSDVVLKSGQEKTEKQHSSIYKMGLFTSICHQCVLYNSKKLKPFSFNTDYPVSADFDSILETYYRDPKHFAIHLKKPLIEYQLGGFSDQRLPEILKERKQQFEKRIPNAFIKWWNLLNLKRQTRNL